MSNLTHEEIKQLITIVESARDKELELKNTLIKSLKEYAANYEDNNLNIPSGQPPKIVTVDTASYNDSVFHNPFPPPIYRKGIARIEKNDGRIWSGNYPTHITGSISAWEITKAMVVNNGSTAGLETIGYFYNPAGVICEAGRFRYYAGAEFSGQLLSTPTPRIKYLNDGTPVCLRE